MLKKIQLAKGREQSLQRFHPWVFSGAIKKREDGIKDGALVQLEDFKGGFLGIGHFQDHASISVRILSFVERSIDHAFWVEKLTNAFAYRNQHLRLPSETTNAFRLIHGEGDGLPGLIIDVYDTVAVLQCHSAGMYLQLDAIKDAVLEAGRGIVSHVYAKNKESNLGTKVEDAWLTDGVPMPITVVENDHKFLVDVEQGQKTGFFLDQRNNRALLGHYAPGKTILNLFCYTGGFSIYGLDHGASAVVSVDVSKTAMDAVDQNVALTAHADIHTSLCANVMEYLKDDDIPPYDIVIVDPPAFAKSVAKRHNAVQAYKRLNVLSLGKVKSGGLMFTFSCSQVVGTQLFYDTIVAAAIEAGRQIRVIGHLSQGGDHPVNLFHPEGHYLKGLLLSVE